MTVLTYPTLVLNRSWVPVTTTTVKRALQLLMLETARVIHPETYELHNFESWLDELPTPDERIRTVSLQLRVPEVIVLTFYNGMPRSEVGFTRKNLLRRDRYTCQYCAATPGTLGLSIDHVIPRSRGGPSDWRNCVLACKECNRRKGDRSPREAGMRLRAEPRAPRWTPHFDVSASRRRQSWQHFMPERQWELLRDDHHTVAR